jgi:hypothetical protein
MFSKTTGCFVSPNHILSCTFIKYIISCRIPCVKSSFKFNQIPITTHIIFKKCNFITRIFFR